jgi:hypothetical protein
MKTSASLKSVRQHFNRFAVSPILVGLVLLAVPWPAEAEIVYSKVDIFIIWSSYNLDVNNDGVPDFTLTPDVAPGLVGSVSVTSASGNGVLIGPLSAGDQIGPDQVFAGGTLALISYMQVCSTGQEHPGCWFKFSGPWHVNLKGKRYLGLSFQLNGETYYGWARLTTPEGGRDGARLSGYAYENTPGMPINAGQTTDNSSAQSSGPANPAASGVAAVSNPTQAVSFGTLALVAQEIPLLGGKESAAAASENS